MTKLVLSTGNIVSGGPSIIRKPGAYRSNLELTNSLRSNFLAAQEYYAATAAAAAAAAAQNGNGSTNGHGNGASLNFGSGRRRQPASVWTERAPVVSAAAAGSTNGDSEAAAMYIPRIDWSAAGLQEEATRYDITAKLFFLPTAPASQDERRRYAREALGLVLRELGAPAVDLLIVSMPGMSFEGDCEWEADRANAVQGNDDDEAATWAVAEELHHAGLVKRLGVAEFGSDKLARLLKRVAVPPAVDQINIKNCCNVPPPLVELARAKGIELLVHSDCTDVLPKGTLRELLGQGLQGAGILADAADPDDEDAGVDGLHGDLIPQWVVKYTAVVRDRGVIENKGYFAAAELTET